MAGTWNLDGFTVSLVRSREATPPSRRATLEVIVKGRAVIRANGRRIDLHSGCAVFRPARSRARTQFESGTEWLHIECGTPDELPTEICSETTARAWSLGLIEEVVTREPGWKLIVAGHIRVGLGRMMRASKLSDHRPEWLDRVTDLARQQQTLAAIAKAIDRHPSHIAREFRRHEGVSIGEYARRCRLELAARALRDGETIATVALDAGFFDQSHFTNAFHRVFGLTPASFQRNGTKKFAPATRRGTR